MDLTCLREKPTDGGTVKWDHFVRIFKLKYMPRAMQIAKQLEFEKLKQGNMSVGNF